MRRQPQTSAGSRTWAASFDYPMHCEHIENWERCYCLVGFDPKSTLKPTATATRRLAENHPVNRDWQSEGPQKSTRSQKNDDFGDTMPQRRPYRCPRPAGERQPYGRNRSSGLRSSRVAGQVCGDVGRELPRACSRSERLRAAAGQETAKLIHCLELLPRSEVRPDT